MIVLICGSRNQVHSERLDITLDAINVAIGPFKKVIHGNARGVDRLAGRWAKSRGIEVETFDADWDRHGEAAGPIRNRRMLTIGRPDVVIAFPGGSGTADMVGQAEESRRRTGSPEIVRVSRKKSGGWSKP